MIHCCSRVGYDLHRTVAEAIERRGVSGLGHHVRLVHHWFARTRGRAHDHTCRSGRRRSHSCGRVSRGAFVRRAVCTAGGARPDRLVAGTPHSMASRTGGCRARPGRCPPARCACNERARPRRSTDSKNVVSGAGDRIVGADGAAAATPRRSSAREPAAAADAYVARAYRTMAQVAFFGNDPSRYLCFAAQSMVYAARGKQIAELSGALAEIGGLFGYAASSV